MHFDIHKLDIDTDELDTDNSVTEIDNLGIEFLLAKIDNDVDWYKSIYQPNIDIYRTLAEVRMEVFFPEEKNNPFFAS